MEEAIWGGEINETCKTHEQHFSLQAKGTPWHIKTVLPDSQTDWLWFEFQNLYRSLTPSWYRSACISWTGWIENLIFNQILDFKGCYLHLILIEHITFLISIQICIMAWKKGRVWILLHKQKKFWTRCSWNMCAAACCAWNKRKLVSQLGGECRQKFVKRISEVFKISN